MINTPTIIGLTGHAGAGAGKDTVASIILDAYTGDGIAVAFADALRLEVCAAFDVYTHTLSCRQTKEKPLPDLALDHCNDERFVRRMTEHYASGLREGGYVPFGPFLAGAGVTALVVGPAAMLRAVGL